MKKYYLHLFATLLLTLLFYTATAVSAEPPSSKTIIKYSPPQKNILESIADFLLPHYERRNVLYEKESEFLKITVEDDESGKRHLVFHPNKGSQGIIRPDDPDKIVPNFLRYAFLAYPLLEAPPKNILFIGLGAGIMPRFVSTKYPKSKIDIVEIDKAVPPIAEKYFGFRKSENINLIIEDGRFFANRSKNKYDMIVIDAYNATSIPFQVTTQQFFLKLKGMLENNGIIVANIANLGKDNFIKSEFKTIQSVFKNIAVVTCPYKTNYVLFASDNLDFNNEKWHEKSLKFDQAHKWHFKLAPYLDSRIPTEELKKMTEEGKILTDNFAPVNSMN